MRLAPNRPTASIGVVAALVAILAILALLQYKWSGQVSEADRERMETSLQNSVNGFRQDFYRTLLNVCTAFRLSRAMPASNPLALYTEHYQDWISTTQHTSLVSNVFVWEAEGDRSRLFRLNPGSDKPEETSWPSGFDAARLHFSAQMDDLRRLQGRDLRLFAWTFEEEIPALFHPVLQFSASAEPGIPPAIRVTGYLIVQLNMNYVQERLLPELAQRHFGGPKGFIYRVEVVRVRNPSLAIYRSDPTLPHDALYSADARVDLLSPPTPEFPGPPPEPAFEGREPPEGPDARRQPGFRASAVILPSSEEGRWQLVVKHRSGSLDAVVTNLRRRNLAVGFGVLLLLAVSMAMIVVYSQRSQRLARLQLDFVAGVSHELRTPLAVICSAGDNLADGVIDPDPQVKQYGELIRTEGRRLTGMVEQILHFAAGQSGRARLEIRPVTVGEVIDSVLADSEVAIQGTSVSVEKKIEAGLPPVSADFSAVKQCLQNLISNALKYGGGTSWLGIQARVDANNGRREVQITVEDKGPGIDESDLRHIFEPFYRGKTATAAQIHGTGLGLSLAKDIAEAMGGRITVQTASGRGSAFTLHLPATEKMDEPTNTSGRG